MTEQLVSPQTIGNDVKKEVVTKILGRLHQIYNFKDLLPKDEKVHGIFKTKGFLTDHIVITNYRIFSVEAVEQKGSRVFSNELTERDIQAITVQATKGVFNKISYTIDIEKNGKKSKYATIHPSDSDQVIRLLEKIQPNETPASLIKVQKELTDKENAVRKAEKEKKAASKRTESEKLKKQAEAKKAQEEKEKRARKAEERQAKIHAREEQKNAKIAAAKQRGKQLGYVYVKYLGGYEPQDKKTFFEGRLLCFENEVIYTDRNMAIPASQIVSFEISGKEQTNSRLSVTRMVTLGVFSLAAPKRSTKKEASIFIGLKDGRQVLFHTDNLTESDVHRKLVNAISHYSSLQKASNNQLQRKSKPRHASAAEEIAQFAKLREQGILTDEEFEAKKKQLLGL